MTDQLLAGRYRLGAQLGQGGMGRVWRARDETLGRDVAVKEVVLPADLPQSERAELTQRALREAQAAAVLDHPGIVTVHDVIVADDRPWIVMELIIGRSLRQAAPLPPQAVAGIGGQVLDALRAAHARGVLHRDVKPSNILLADDGRVVLTDFGIASLTGDPSLTRSGTLVGSPGFIAPERLREEPYGPSSDLWSLGATLYAAVEGRPPFHRDGSMAVLGAVLTEEPPVPVRAGPLGPLLWHLLVKDPAARITAERAADELGRVAAGMPPGLVVPALTVPGPAVRRGRAGRRTLTVAAAGVAFTAVLAAGVAVAWSQRPEGGAAQKSSPPAVARSSPVAARYTKRFALCDVVGAQQMRRLIPTARRTQYAITSVDSCYWTSKAERASLLVAYFLPDGHDSPWNVTANAARADFAKRKNQDLGGDTLRWQEKEIGMTTRIPGRHSAKRAIAGVGEEAYTYDLVNPTTGSVDRTWVDFRDSNVIIHLSYTRPGHTGDDARIHQGAIDAAKTIVATLRRQQ